jgi:CHAT domain/AAA ATPase domain
MAETKELTFSVKPKGNQVSVVLTGGAPWEQGPKLGKSAGILWQTPGLTEADVRGGILEDKPSLPVLKKARKDIGHLLLGGTIANAWASKGAGVRCYLKIDAALEWVPWETAADPTTDQPLFIRLPTPFVRYQDPGKILDRPKSDRLLMVVVVSVQDSNSIGAARELKLLREAVRPVDRLIEMVILRNPTRDRMFQEIQRKPAILHFIGHGDAAELKLWTGTQNEPWARAEIGTDLDTAGWSPNFVFLNACHGLTGAAATGLTKRNWSLARVFVEKGASAVLAMQGPISGQAAGLLAQEFYRAVAQGESADVALTRGRSRLLRHPVYGKTREPYLAALVTSGSLDGLLACTSCRDEDGWIDKRIYKGLISNCEVLLPAVDHFVDRDQHRWKLLDQLNSPTESKPACLVTGPSGSGKTWLLAWCIDGWLRRRYRVHYVRMSGCADWLKFIRSLRDGAQEPGVVHEGLSKAASDFLTWRLIHLAKGGTRRPPEAIPDPVPPDNIDLKKAQKKAPEFHIHAFAALAEALMLDPGENPVVLVLDDFDDGKNKFPSADLELLVTHFVKAQILARKNRIRAVLSISDSELLNYPGIVPASIARVPVGVLSEDMEDNIRLAYKLRYDAELPALWEEKLPDVAKKPRTGAQLEKLCKLIYDSGEELSCAP